MLLFGLWLGATAAAFWHFQGRLIRPFQPEPPSEIWQHSLDGYLPAFAALRGVTAARPTGAPVLFHFWDPDCPCSRFNVDHVRALVARFRPAGVEFVVVTPQGTADAAKRVRETFGTGVLALARAPRQAAVPASPAALLFGADGRPRYFGPYSSGAFCSATNGAYVETALEELQAGRPGSTLEMLAVGCYCTWPDAPGNTLLAMH